jgi:diaminohydroxyphosphoribosylaminopyrimidine deaminase / 5-amino-6-(5-phosphoribosylamino)uracil reductase
MLIRHPAKLGNLDHIKHHVNFGAMSNRDRLYMQRALELAVNGRGTVSPNPMVGCVIVHDDKIIGEGWHAKYGKAHAEVNAINSVKDASVLPKSTCYVTLEPCAHHGRTAPCADLLVDKKIKKVVIGCQDTNPQVGGKGIKKLREAGIDVEVGILEQDCRNLNVRFFTAIEKNRPFVILKWAQTKDGFIARENFDSKWISNEASRTLVHQWRSEEDAILVGFNTAKYDDPSLNVRDWEGKNPLRIVIDKSLDLEKGLKLFDRSIPTIVYNLEEDSNEDNLEYVKVAEENFVENLLKDLKDRGVGSLIVEGGASVLNSFISNDLWDEARVFSNSTTFENGIKAPDLNMKSVEVINVLNDRLEIYINEKN